MILAKSMGFGCFRSGDDKNTVLRSCQIESDSLVNNQILREIDEGICNASFTIEPRAQSLDFMIMATKNYLQIGRKCEMCSCIMLAEKATKHRNQRYDIYWKCKNCGFQIRELERGI